MVGVEQGYLDMVSWFEFELDWGVKRKRFQQVLEMLVRQYSSFQDALGIVDTARDGLETEKDLSGGGRAVNAEDG